MKRIFLIGYMGAGKTTVGKELAGRLELTFIDLDCYIEKRYHKTVGQLFADKGEAAFREIEWNMLREIGTFENVLVSTGGGVPCFFDNMEFMCKAGTTVYLKVSVEELANRLEVCKGTRPVLKGRSGDKLKQFIADSLEKRTGFYSQAEIIFDAEQMLTETDVSNIVNTLEKML
ncbi:MAG: shikimate kinase [Tannerellaceae bacterium]|nr:shikimate kinase [Tannerellaceae bacterium]